MKILSIVGILFFVIVSPTFAQIVFPDGSQQDTAALELTNVVKVDADGTDTQNGTALLNAVASLGEPAKPTIILLDSGTYDVGTSALTLFANTELRGFGGATRITGDGAVTVTGTSGGSSIAHLTIENTASNSTVFLQDGGEADLVQTSIVHTAAGSGTNYGIRAINGADVGLRIDSEIEFEGAGAGGIFTAMSVTGTNGAANLSGGAEIDARGTSGSMTIIGLEIGAGVSVRVEAGVRIHVSNTTALSAGVIVANTGFLSLMNSEITVEGGGDSIDNDGTVVARHSHLNVLPTGSGNEYYVDCSTGEHDSSLAAIEDTNEDVIP